jgi:predicted ATP-dependent endonuclease of OLD family
MELFQVDVAGYRKFRDRARLKARGKLIAILGANEAGKSSLLRAIERLGDGEPYLPHEKSRSLEAVETSIVARFSLSDEDRELAGVPKAIWYDVHKWPDGRRAWSIEPRPDDRDYSLRKRLVSAMAVISGKEKAVAYLSEKDAELVSETSAFFSDFGDTERDLTETELETLSALAGRWGSAIENDTPKYLRSFAENLRDAIPIESAESVNIKGGNILWKRLPDFLFFGANDRDLKSSYSWADLQEEIPHALKNLARVAELDLEKLIEIREADHDDPRIDTMWERANQVLEQKFQNAWKQSSLSVVLGYRNESLLVQVYNNERERTDFSQRSDGLRQFVALRCFTVARESDNFILLIDEAEQHLHYDAQADLVQMLASQTVASKVIYTTHSVGCLPEDLGNGVRLVEPTARASDWSKIENKFWSNKQPDEAAFSPILMGMGASTMAFFPTRSAVLVEGPADTILLPTMFRESLDAGNLGIQFVHGLSEDSRMHLPLLNSTGRQVCYLLDDDDGGRKLKSDLEERRVDASKVFQLKRRGGDCELEDFIDPSLLAEAVNLLGGQHLGIAELVKRTSMPKFGKWDRIEEACNAAKVPVLSKVEVAYTVLDLLDSDPTRNILDKSLKKSFGAIVEKVLGEAKGMRVNN